MNDYIPKDTLEVFSYPYSNPDTSSTNIYYWKRPPSGDLEGVIFVCILSRLTMLWGGRVVTITSAPLKEGIPPHPWYIFTCSSSPALLTLTTLWTLAAPSWRMLERRAPAASLVRRLELRGSSAALILRIRSIERDSSSWRPSDTILPCSEKRTSMFYSPDCPQVHITFGINYVNRLD